MWQMPMMSQALNPRDPAVLSGRGVCSMELGRFSQACGVHVHVAPRRRETSGKPWLEP